MNKRTRGALSIIAAGMWITSIEFLRNELLLKEHWTDHYESMGLVFPSGTVNGIVWTIWAFVYAGLILAVSRKFTFIQTGLLCWTAGFVLMWLVIGNMLVLPFGILYYAVPFSLVEAFAAVWLVNLISPPSSEAK